LRPTLGLLILAAAGFGATPAIAQSTSPPLTVLPSPSPPTAAVRVTWSEVTGQQWNRATKDRLATIIREVDGRRTIDRLVKTDPGYRELLVESLPRRGFAGTDKRMRLLAMPCKRYYVNAHFRGPTGTSWDPVVVKTEDIAGCRRS
jgi:hypothetical protein